MGEERLKPCPFCEAAVNNRKGFGGVVFFDCLKCGAIVSFRGINTPNVKDPVKSWNERIANERIGEENG